MLGGQGRAVDFPPMPLGQLIPAVGEKFGLVMACSGLLRNQVVLIQAKQATIEDLEKRIADAVGGQWRSTKTGLVLERTAALDKELRAKALASRTAAVEKQIAKAVAEVEKTPVFDIKAGLALEEELAREDAVTGEDDFAPARMAQKMLLFDRAPSNRAEVRILSLIGAAEIAAIPYGTTVAYSLTPNRYQKPLPQKTVAVIQTMMRENEAWRQALADAPTRPERHSWMGGDPRMQVHETGTPAKVVLQITAYNRMATIPAELFIADSKGKLLLHSRLQLSGFYDGQKHVAAEAAVAKNPDFKVTDEAKTFQGFYDLNYGKDRPQMTHEWDEVFGNPQKRDPLSFTITEVLKEAARRQNLDLIAVLIDDLLREPESAKSGSFNLAGYLSAIDSFNGLSVTKDDGWLVARPAERDGPAPQNIDRDALHKYCFSLQQTGVISLDAMADLVSTATNEGWYEVPFSYTAALVPRGERLMQFQSVPLLRLYGALSPEQRATLRKGGAISIREMSEACKHFLESLILNQQFENQDRIVKADNDGHLADPPLESLPSEILGFPMASDISISCKPVLEPAVVIGTPAMGNFAPWTTVVSTQQLPASLGRSIAQDAAAKQSDLWFGNRLRLNLTITLPNGYSFVGAMEEVQVNMRQKSTHYADLSAEMRKQVDQAASQAPRPRPSGTGGVPPPR